MSLLAAASSLASGGVGGSSGPSGVYDSGDINVCPFGTNLGEIMKIFTENAAENGGYGYTSPSRLASTSGNVTSSSKFNTAISPVTDFFTNPIVWGVGLFGALILLRKGG